MSTNWYVHCLDCQDTHRFDGANHLDEEMATLCKHADAIAAIAPLIDEAGISIDLRTSVGNINPDWFVRHKRHKLIPINEYGAVLGQCATRVDCGCGSRQRCTLNAGHDGPHDPTSRETRRNNGPRAITGQQAAALLRLLLAAEKWSTANSHHGGELARWIAEAQEAMGRL